MANKEQSEVMIQTCIRFFSLAIAASIRFVRPLHLCRLSAARVAVAQAVLLLCASHNPARAECAQPRPCATAPVDLGTLGGDWARVLGISDDGASRGPDHTTNERATGRIGGKSANEGTPASTEKTAGQLAILPCGFATGKQQAQRSNYKYFTHPISP